MGRKKQDLRATPIPASYSEEDTPPEPKVVAGQYRGVPLPLQPGTVMAADDGGAGRRYPPNFKRAVREAWASGEYNSDDEIADVFGITDGSSINRWRANKEPDGISWMDVRRQLAQQSLDIVTQQLGESRAEAVLRHIKMSRAMQSTIARYVFGQRLELADGSVVTIPAVEPKSLGEAANAYIAMARFERHLRGEPDVRVEHYLTMFGEVVAVVAQQFIAEMALPPAALARFEAMFTEQMQQALEAAENKLAPASEGHYTEEGPNNDD